MSSFFSDRIIYDTGELTAETVSVWWNQSYPFRKRLSIEPIYNPYRAGEVATTTLPIGYSSAKKVSLTLDNIAVVRYLDNAGVWEPASVSVSKDSEFIYVSFQLLEEVDTLNDSYYIYYGRASSNPVLPEFTGQDFYNSIDFSSMYTSFTNPDEDWIKEGGVVIGDTIGGSLFARLSLSKFKIIGSKSPEGGVANVYINEHFAGKIDFLSQELEESQELFSYDLAGDSGLVEIQLQISETNSAMSTGNVVKVEEIRYDTYGNLELGPEEFNPRLSWIANTGASNT